MRRVRVYRAFCGCSSTDVVLRLCTVVFGILPENASFEKMWVHLWETGINGRASIDRFVFFSWDRDGGEEDGNETPPLVQSTPSLTGPEKQTRSVQASGRNSAL